MGNIISKILVSILLIGVILFIAYASYIVPEEMAILWVCGIVVGGSLGVFLAS